MKFAVQQLVTRADADHVFDMLIDPVLFVSWMAEDATLGDGSDTRPGEAPVIAMDAIHGSGHRSSGFSTPTVPSGRRSSLQDE